MKAFALGVSRFLLLACSGYAMHKPYQHVEVRRRHFPARHKYATLAERSVVHAVLRAARVS